MERLQEEELFNAAYNQIKSQAMDLEDKFNKKEKDLNYFEEENYRLST
jgi:hypothetical protein